MGNLVWKLVQQRLFQSRAAASLFCSAAPCLPPGARRAVNLQQNSPVSSFTLGLGREWGRGRGEGQAV